MVFMMRSLPKRHNPLIQEDVTPSFEELLSRRRLGKTKLSVQPGQIGTTNATKPENLGTFEYAHLRAPLPKDLRGSELFQYSQTAQYPDSYFLMRRSKDGYVSATGMFKIAFPWGKQIEEKNEREYLRGRPDTSEDETAGNVWISPGLALDLAREYRMFEWVRALLDSTDIIQTGSPEHQISSPPKFEFPAIDSSAFAPPKSSARSRTLRSASPSKMASPSKKTPRKRQTRAQKEASAPSSSAANESLQNTLNAAASNADEASAAEDTRKQKQESDEEEHEVNGKQEGSEAGESVAEAEQPSDRVKVNVESTVDVAGDLETSRTNVSVEMPTGLPELPIPEDTEQMIAKAKEMVEEATKLQQEEQEGVGNPSPKDKKKRKAKELAVESEGEGESGAQPPKRARLLEDRLRRERVRNRALVGVTATLAIAAAIPYFF